MQSVIFKFFISSTFKDFNQERLLLQKYVFPEIKKHCAKLGKGYVFQPIDLRWGVSNEAQLDQKTLDICLGEVKSCKSQPHPNFLIMTGDRYGWVPLPYSIEKLEFEKICQQITIEQDKELINQWYRLDLNQIPESYNLKHRTDDYKKYEKWEVVETQLRNILQTAVNKANDCICEDEKQKYFMSATEAEVVHGVLKYDPLTAHQKSLIDSDRKYKQLDLDNVYGYIRNVTKIEDNNYVEAFKDDDSTNVNRFKKLLRASIKSTNLIETKETKLQKLSEEKNGSLNYQYKEIEGEEKSEFVTKITEYIKYSIDNYVNKNQYTDEELEKHEQERFRKDKLRLFIGRENALGTIDNYISGDIFQPLIIYSRSGLGKSALMAQAIERYKYKDIFFKFIGATSSISSTRDLIRAILKEFDIEEPMLKKDKKNRPDWKQYYIDISESIKQISRDAVIFIDAVDQLNDGNEIENDSLSLWLPESLPANLKIIISVLDDDSYEEDKAYFVNLSKRIDNVYQLGDYKNCKELVTAKLKKYNRKVSDKQLEHIETKFNSVRTPFFLTIAAEEARHWHHNDTPELEETQKKIVADYLVNLSERYYHDSQFIFHVFSILYLANGITESELLGIISQDSELIKRLAPPTYHFNYSKRLPDVIWARLKMQVNEFIKNCNQAGQETVGLFHRELNSVIKEYFLNSPLIEFKLRSSIINYFNRDQIRNFWQQQPSSYKARVTYEKLEQKERIYVDLLGEKMSIPSGLYLDDFSSAFFQEWNTPKDILNCFKYYKYIPFWINDWTRPGPFLAKQNVESENFAMSDYINSQAQTSCSVPIKGAKKGRKVAMVECYIPYSPNKNERRQLAIENTQKAFLLFKWNDMQSNLDDIWTNFVGTCGADDLIVMADMFDDISTYRIINNNILLPIFKNFSWINLGEEVLERSKADVTLEAKTRKGLALKYLDHEINGIRVEQGRYDIYPEYNPNEEVHLDYTQKPFGDLFESVKALCSSEELNSIEVKLWFLKIQGKHPRYGIDEDDIKYLLPILQGILLCDEERIEKDTLKLILFEVIFRLHDGIDPVQEYYEHGGERKYMEKVFSEILNMNEDLSSDVTTFFKLLLKALKTNGLFRSDKNI